MVDTPGASNVQFPSVPQGQPQGTAPAAAPQTPIIYVQPAKPSGIRRFFFFISMLLLLVAIFAMGAWAGMLSTRIDTTFAKKVVTQGAEDEVIAIYQVEGVIDDKAAQQFGQFCQEIKDDSKVKAVVLRVNSPGGMVSSSDEIHQAIIKLKKDGKAVVVSMGGVAASGGYYISAPADAILAEPTTVTGSIGVIMQLFIVKEGLGKLGIEPLTIKSSSAQLWKDEASPFRTPDSRQLAHLTSILDTMQQRFNEVVRDGRKNLKTAGDAKVATTVGAGTTMKDALVVDNEPLNGKIYLAQEAKKWNLIDGIGYLDDAVDKAKELKKLSKPTVVRYERTRGLFAALTESKTNIGINIDSSTMDDLQTPKFMMLWKPE